MKGTPMTHAWFDEVPEWRDELLDLPTVDHPASPLTAGIMKIIDDNVRDQAERLRQYGESVGFRRPRP